jgi:hypothetical protein
MKRAVLILGAALALVITGCAHNRGGTESDYDTNYGRGYDNQPSWDYNNPTTTTNGATHIEPGPEPEYPVETDPQIK